GLQRAQQLARDLAIVERVLHSGDLLPLLVALAGDQDDVAVARALERACDSAAPVRLDVEVGRAGEHLVDDRERILAARVVGGDDRDVGELRRDASHEWALLAIAVPAAADDAEQTAARELAGGEEHPLERRGLVR